MIVFHLSSCCEFVFFFLEDFVANLSPAHAATLHALLAAKIVATSSLVSFLLSCSVDTSHDALLFLIQLALVSEYLA